MAGLTSILKPGTSGSKISRISASAGSMSAEEKAKEAASKAARQKEYHTQALANAKVQAAQTAANYGKSDGSGVSFSGVKNSWFKNGNPMARSGRVKMSMGGAGYSVPNSFAQQMLYRQAVNSGRWGIGELAGGSLIPDPKRLYEDATAKQAAVEKEAKKFDTGRATRGDLESEMEDTQAKYLEMQKPQILNEEVALNGQVIKSNALERQGALQQIMGRMNKLGQEIEKMRRRREEGGINSRAFEGLISILKNAPTRSNLPIKESVVR